MAKDAVPFSEHSYAVDESRSGSQSTHLLPEQEGIVNPPGQPAKSMVSIPLKPSSASTGTINSQQATRNLPPQQAQMPMVGTAASQQAAQEPSPQQAPDATRKLAEEEVTDLSATSQCSSQKALQHASDFLDAALTSSEAGSLSAAILAAVKALGSADPGNSMLLQVSSPPLIGQHVTALAIISVSAGRW